MNQQLCCQLDWESVFDRRNSGGSGGEPPSAAAVAVPLSASSPFGGACSGSPSSASTPPADFNPWSTSDIKGSGAAESSPSWADFASSAFGSSNHPQHANTFSTNPFESFQSQGDKPAVTAEAPAATEFTPFEARFGDFESPEPASSGEYRYKFILHPLISAFTFCHASFYTIE